MRLLSIQSHVAYGHVGNAAAVFPLQRLGIDVWPVHTVQFSNHPGYGQWRGRVVDAATVRDLVQGIEERGALATCDGVLSGYMGSAEIGDAILGSVARVKRANPAAQYCCDPVIGDSDRGVYVDAAVPAFMIERAVPAAEVVTPNQFELEQIAGQATAALSDLLAAIDAVHAHGPRVVLVTSVHTEETPADAIDNIVSDGAGRFRVRTPKLPLQVNGAGDAIAALFFAHLLGRRPVGEAMALAVSSMFGVLRHTLAAGSREIMLVAAQEEIVAPSQVVRAEAIR
jgi:pyridoxine kinase